MNICCEHLRPIFELAINDGNSLASISDSPLMKKVIWMDKKISLDMKEKTQSMKNGLVHEYTKDMPHAGAMEYFICYECRNVIAFPRR